MIINLHRRSYNRSPDLPQLWRQTIKVLALVISGMEIKCEEPREQKACARAGAYTSWNLAKKGSWLTLEVLKWDVVQVTKKRRRPCGKNIKENNKETFPDKVKIAGTYPSPPIDHQMHQIITHENIIR